MKAGLYGLAIAALAIGCSAEAPPPEGAIIVLPGAVNVRSARGFEAAGTEYELVQADARTAIDAVSDRLKAGGWTPLAALASDRNQKTGQEAGWTCFPSSEKAITYQWMTDWRNTTGDVVTYRFAGPEELVRDGRGAIAVEVHFTPAEIADAGGIAPAASVARFDLSRQCQDILASLSRPD